MITADHYLRITWLLLSSGVFLPIVFLFANLVFNYLKMFIWPWRSLPNKSSYFVAWVFIVKLQLRRCFLLFYNGEKVEVEEEQQIVSQYCF